MAAMVDRAITAPPSSQAQHPQQNPSRQSMKISNVAKFAFKAVVSVALVWWVLQGVDGGALVEHIAKVSGLGLAAAVVGFMLMVVLQAFRWRIVLASLDAAISPRSAISITMLSAFFSQALPSTVGGDVARVWNVRAQGISLAIATNSVIIDRLVGLLALLALGALSAPFIFGLADGGAAAYAMAGLTLAAVAGCTVLVGIRKLPQAWTKWLVFRGFASLSQAFWSLLVSPRVFLKTFGLSVVIQLGIIFVTYLLGFAMDVTVGLGSYLAIMPPVLLASNLPISIAGWGVRESAMIVGLGLVGVPADAALAVSLLLGGVVAASGLAGAALWVLERRLPGAR